MKNIVRFACAVMALALIGFEPSNALAQGQALVKSKRVLKVAAPLELKGKELNQFRQYSLADAVRYYSGLQFKDFGGMGGLKTINIRSLGSERMGVFYNGLEIGNAMNGQVDLTKFSLDNVGDLSIFSGQKGDIFQCAKDFASTNSLYITTRRPIFKREDEQRTNFIAQVRGGSNFMVNPSILVEHDLGKYVYTSVNVEMLTAKNPYPFHYQRKSSSGDLLYDTKAKRENNDIHAMRAEASLHGTISSNAVASGTWNCFAYHYSSERGIPGPIINNNWFRGERLDERNNFLQGGARLDVNDWYRTQIMLKASADYTHYRNSDDKLAVVDESYLQYGAYLSSSHQFSILSGWKASLAYDFQFDLLQKNDEIINARPADFTQPRRMMHLLAVATQYQWEGLSLQASALGTYVQNMTAKGFEKPKDEMGISPAFMVYYQPFKRIDFYLQAYVKQTFRVPSYNDRYISLLVGEELRPEKVTQYDLGLNYSRKSHDFVSNFGISVEGYYNQVADKIIAYPRGQLFKWTMTNLGKVEIFGGDAIGHITFSLPDKFLITTKLQYTYQIARDVTNPDDTYFNHQIPNIPWHSGSAIVRLSWRRWALNYSFLYAGKRYSEQENIPYNELQPWYTHDISLSKMFKIGEWNFKAMVEVNNMIGQPFEIVTNYPMPKQTVRLTLTTELQ